MADSVGLNLGIVANKEGFQKWLYPKRPVRNFTKELVAGVNAKASGVSFTEAGVIRNWVETGMRIAK
jgi:hypothetical protein